MRSCNIISLKLIHAFEKLGRLIATHPKRVIILSMFSSLILGLGMIKIGLLTDFTYIYSPLNCRAYKEKHIIDQLFPINISYNFDNTRLTTAQAYGFAIITANDGRSLLRKSVFTEIAAFNEMVVSFDVKWKDRTYTYADICAKNNGRCYANLVLNYTDEISQIEANETDIKYPADLDLLKMDLKITASYFGGVKTDETKEITEVKAIRLMYYLDNNNEETKQISLKWEKEFRNRVFKHKSEFITINTFLLSDFELFSWNIIFMGLKCGLISSALILIFCIGNLMTSDWVTSKPTLAVAGCISVVMAILSSTGMISAFGFPITSTNIALLFLITGIGVDDMFILIAAWRSSDEKDSVTNRMAITYSHSALAVTISSATNLVTFIVGTIVPVPTIRIFCGHGAVAVVFDLIYQLTFFGGCMALDGYREEKKLHPLTLKPVILRQDTDHRSYFGKILFTDKSQTNQHRLPRLMLWYRKLGYWISKTEIRIFILIAFIFYLAGASWGIKSLRNGLEFRNLFPYYSQSYTYALVSKRYFIRYAYPLQIAFNATLDYSDRKVQKKILQSVNRFHRSEQIENIDYNWLKHYLFMSRYNRTYSKSYNLTDPKGFIDCLRNEFFHHPFGRMYRNDVQFHDDGRHITASRFVIFTNSDTDALQQKIFITRMRSIADSLPFSVTVQSPVWINYELNFVIDELTIQSVTGCIAAILLVFSLLASHLPTILLVALTILSIQFGFIGFMSLLEITLNPVSVILLILSIGFSVDSLAHTSCAYKDSEGNYRERVQRTLFAVGMPIMQGCCSTVVSVIPLAFLQFYNFRVFAILVCLLITISFIHAIFILPTLLSFWDVIAECFGKSMNVEGSKKHTSSSSSQAITTISVIATSHF